MSTQPTTEAPVKSKAEIEAEALVTDETVTTDKAFCKLMAQVDQHQLKVGGKWADVIEHVKSSYPFDGTGKEAKEHKEGFKIILKSLMAMGKTYSSAQSIRSYIFKMAREENAELLAKLKAGEVTVRATRQAGTARQSSPSKSLQAKFDESLNNAVRFGASLNMTPETFAKAAQLVFAQYLVTKATEKTLQGPVKPVAAEVK